MKHRFMCPVCGNHTSIRFKSKQYGINARKCKSCGHINWGKEWAEKARQYYLNSKEYLK